jgi:hypothetical protein
MALHALSLLTQRRLIDDIEAHKDRAKLIVLPPPCPLSVQPIDFSHANLLINRAHADACEFLDGGGADRPPIRMRMHAHAVGTVRASAPQPSEPRDDGAPQRCGVLVLSPTPQRWDAEASVV